MNRHLTRTLAAATAATLFGACRDVAGPVPAERMTTVPAPALDRGGDGEGAGDGDAAAFPRFGEWSTPVRMDEPINDPSGSTRAPGLSPDGQSLYLSSDRSGTLGDLDLWVSHRRHGTAAWESPRHLDAPLSTAFHDANPDLSANGHTLFFNSLRPGGCGNQDLWMSTRRNVHDDFAWSAPVNVGCVVNGAGIDQGAAYLLEPRTHRELLYYSSDQPGALGKRDIFVSARNADGSWGRGSPVVELNSAFDEARPTVRRDGLEIFFWSGDRTGGIASYNVWTSTRTSIDAPWSRPVAVFGRQSLPALSPDGTTLYMSTSRPSNPAITDLYVSSRQPLYTAAEEWNALARTILRARAVDAVVSRRPSPNLQARILAYLGLAEYRAVTTADENDRASDDGDVAGELSHRASSVTRGAVVGASATILSYFFPLDAATFSERLGQLTSEVEPDRRAALAKGRAMGEQVALALVERARTDGFDAPYLGTQPLGEQYWHSLNVPPTPPLLPALGAMTPFHLRSGAQFRPAPPPEYGSPEFVLALREVRHYSDTRTDEQRQIALKWAPPSLPSMWSQMLSDIIAANDLDERQAARTYATAFTAAFDALIACHDAKYFYWYPRPTQADGGIVPAVTVPNHPSFPSNHACGDGALDEVVGHLFPRQAADFHAAMEEGAISRLYGGLHYRFDAAAGLGIGHAVGRVALADHDVFEAHRVARRP